MYQVGVVLKFAPYSPFNPTSCRPTSQRHAATLIPRGVGATIGRRWAVDRGRKIKPCKGFKIGLKTNTLPLGAPGRTNATCHDGYGRDGLNPWALEAPLPLNGI
ncbi:hypothetical protein [Apis mellifera associated microvirus 36]|nr:hypothetical protein [Apis mellifera associated microvirus 36]